MRLDIGCGEHPREGYIGVDMRALAGVEIVCNAWEILKYVPAHSIEAIYSRHMLEHLTRRQGEQALKAWRAALIPGGCLEILVPDIEFHVRQLNEPGLPSIFNRGISNIEHAHRGFFGWGRGPWDLHKTAFTEVYLRHQLVIAGFQRIKRVPDNPWHLHVTAKTVRS